ncbi:hypothetical protein Ciccas_012518 [Cichlidogyrus casuarinus]|uniref:Aminomethyltransferase n=1 Tax=Cichlidogyrus casuarinus TaxID=1844966 RepID=A0ABD2PPJ2_9PLAT
MQFRWSQHVVLGHVSRRCISSQKRTALYDFHVAHGAKMVPYAGFQMPLQYANKGMIETTHWVRQKAGLFDVSHMLQANFHGSDARAILETLTPADLQPLKPGNAVLSLYLTEQAGILDDTIISKVTDTHFYGVSNAGCAEKIRAHLQTMQQQLFSKNDLKIEFLNDYSLLALQGPKSEHVLRQGLSSSDAERLSQMAFMQGIALDRCFGIQAPIRVTRCGYTGEDGFEISVPNNCARTLAEAIHSNELVELIGLGTRDVLRLEAGMCLYGNDLDETVDPVQASLQWTISKRRRDSSCVPKFLGFDQVRRNLKEMKQLPRKRIGLTWPQGPQARNGALVFDEDGNKVGLVSSGCLSPTLGTLIAMAYVPAKVSKVGHKLWVEVRGKKYQVTVTEMPFVPNKFKRK